ncbi:hypothetical protein N0V83_009728 [Neocucurbitaria cava]|uniref:Uncharacterized protein n=1 Tax=Neocucurbitaria cava TaxID=798079 RepID=A0A9W9CI47_9PLEO|nr:hypothetical protein N0V83_009728 [Neocucurbitaria cava]
MSGSNWFGNLQLAYKYIVVFLGLLVLTIIGGCIKVLFDRRKLKKAKAVELEAGPKEDTVELNQREKDEGDLFGIRAIEAGFYAGVAQSRPTSRAGSVIEHPNMSTSTLVGNNPSSPLMKGHSTTNSVLSLQLGSNDTNSQRRKSPPTKLRPSEAELNGRRNHNGAVDMSLHVPPSPGLPRGPASPTFGGSDSESDGFTSPRSMSPRSADFNPQHYAPAPTIPMPDALRVSYHSGDNNATSQAASFNNTPGQSPTPPSPGNPPAARLPTLPAIALRKESRSPSPESEHPQVRVYQPNNELAQPSSAPQKQLQSYAPTHKRDESEASSIYSNGNRLSTYQAYQAYQKGADRSTSAASSESYNYGFSSTDESGHTSVVLSGDKESEGRPSLSSSHLAPGGQAGPKDARLSEFYDAYYRNSQIVSAQPVEMKRPVDRKSTIIEVDSPMPSPLFPKSQQPGSAF